VRPKKRNVYLLLRDNIHEGGRRMSKKWIASGIMLFLGIFILVIHHLGITNLDTDLTFLLGAMTFISGIISISFAFGLTISERL
jgi:hypothetical protein